MKIETRTKYVAVEPEEVKVGRRFTYQKREVEVRGRPDGEGRVPIYEHPHRGLDGGRWYLVGVSQLRRKVSVFRL